MTTEPRLGWPGVVARRLARHGLARRSPDASVVDAVRGMVGAHAQVLSAAELSIGLRLEGATRTDVQRALWEDRTLVKTRGPRGTIHLLPTADFGWWATALGAIPGGITQAADVRLTPGQAEAVLAAVADAVADAELTIDELSEAVVAATGPWAADPVLPMFGGGAPRWRQVMGFRAINGVLCSGANRGRLVTYTSPQRWLGGFRPEADPAVALATLVHRYLHSFGPATPAHLARWLAAPIPWATRLFDELAAGDRIEPVRFADERAWVNRGDTEATGRPRGVRLLPYFDSYGVGSHPRVRIFPGAAADRALTGGQAGNVAVVLIDGIVRGVWHRRRTGATVAVTAELFEPLGPARRRALEREVERVGDVLGATATLTLGPVTVGPHA